jgi:conjugal transfer/entry exclusion protein
MLKQLQDQLNDKVDFSRLAELEKLLMDKLNEVVRQLTKQLADKAETKKNLKMLEKQLRNLIDIFAQKQSNPDEDNAMFSKKPLGGISCASCEKNLINL